MTFENVLREEPLGGTLQGISLIACKNCKRQKRRCDKALPGCARCTYNLLDCEYGEMNQPRGPEDALLNLTCGFLSAACTNPADVFAEYCSTVGMWLPIISRCENRPNFVALSLQTPPDIMLLLLSMFLVLQQPSSQMDSSRMRTVLYTKTKQLFTSITSTVGLNMKILQSGLLIAIYEYGHGLSQSAYLSIGMCLRMGHALGWPDKFVMKHGSYENTTALEEELRVWWAIVMFERLVHIDYPACTPFTSSGTITTDIPLPGSNEAWDLTDYEHITNSIPSETARVQAQATLLFAQVLELRSGMHSDSITKQQTAARVNASLLSMLASTIKISDGNFRTHCVAFALIISGMFLMYQIGTLDHSPLGNERDILTMRHTIQVMVDTLEAAQQSLIRHEWAIKELSPAGMWFQCQAAMMHIEFAGDELGDKNWLSAFEVLKEMTRINSGRWDIAASQYVKIQDALTKKTSQLLNIHRR